MQRKPFSTPATRLRIKGDFTPTLHEQVGRGCAHALKTINEEHPVLLGNYSPWTHSHKVTERDGGTIATVTLRPNKPYMHYGSGPAALQSALERGLTKAGFHVSGTANLTRPKLKPTNRKTEGVTFELSLRR